MDVSAFKDALQGQEFKILAVTDQLPRVLDALGDLGIAEVQQVSTKTQAASLIRSRHYNLLLIEDNDDWDDVRKLVKRARSARADSIIVKGAGVHRLNHLRAVLAGADSYVPTDADDWILEPAIESIYKPSDRLALQLEKALSSYGKRTPRALLVHIRRRALYASDATNIRDVIEGAARDVGGTRGARLARLTMPHVQELLGDTAGGLTVHRNWVRAGSVNAPALAIRVPTKQHIIDVGSHVGHAKAGSRANVRNTHPIEPELHWNVRFPDGADILRNRPHIVSAGGEYLLETVLESAAGMGEYSRELSAADLKGKSIAYEFAATNGAFRRDGQENWNRVVVSDSVECSAGGTPPFRVTYRPGDAGEATIEALLLVDGGSIARQTIALTAVGPGASPGRRRRIRREAVGVPGAAINERAGADVMLHMTPQTATLRVNGQLTDSASWLVDLPAQIAPLCREAYTALRALSLQFAPQNEFRLLGQDGPKSLLELATIGSKLHKRVFGTWKSGKAPASLRRLGERIQGMGDRAEHPQLQLVAVEYALPWGILYDRPLPRRELKAEDVDPEGFWGLRYDIYRDVIPTPGLLPRRGDRCRLKPIVGDRVPRGEQQLEFVAQLAASPGPGGSEVLDPSCSPKDVRGWAESGDASDLLYLYCHAIPMDKFLTDGSPEGSCLVFGATERDRARVTLRQLGRWWNGPRLSHPVVILNACASGQSDAVFGAPFVSFFTERWGAQAFVGTDWPVQPALADLVGQALLAEICQKRRSLRQALRSVIDQAAKQNNYFPLMYAIYGPSNVQFAATPQPASTGRAPDVGEVLVVE